MAAKIKKGDKVVVLTGRDKGKTGEVTKVLPSESRVVVSGVNTVKRHQRATQTSAGGLKKRTPPSTCPTWLWPTPRPVKRRVSASRRARTARKCAWPRSPAR